MNTKTCTKCGLAKPSAMFNREPLGRDGRKSICKQCTAIYRQSRRDHFSAYSSAYSRERNAMMGNPTFEKWQRVSRQNAVRNKLPWSAQEDAHLMAGSGRIIDEALELQRTYRSVRHRLHHLRKQGVTLARDKQKETL